MPDGLIQLFWQAIAYHRSFRKANRIVDLQVNPMRGQHCGYAMQTSVVAVKLSPGFRDGVSSFVKRHWSVVTFVRPDSPDSYRDRMSGDYCNILNFYFSYLLEHYEEQRIGESKKDRVLWTYKIWSRIMRWHLCYTGRSNKRWAELLRVKHGNRIQNFTGSFLAACRLLIKKRKIQRRLSLYHDCL